MHVVLTRAGSVQQHAVATCGGQPSRPLLAVQSAESHSSSRRDLSSSPFQAAHLGQHLQVWLVLGEAGVVVERPELLQPVQAAALKVLGAAGEPESRGGLRSATAVLPADG